MKIEQHYYTSKNGWKTLCNGLAKNEIDLTLVFGSNELIKQSQLIGEINNKYPNSIVLGCSTSGEIIGQQVNDDSLTVTAIDFEKTKVKSVKVDISDVSQSYDAGKKIATLLNGDGLKHIFLLSDGLHVNGTELAKGLRENLNPNVNVSGGLAGDGTRFGETYVLDNDIARHNCIHAVGFYGDSIQFGFGSYGGWSSFGIMRKATRSSGSVLYEIDGQPALQLYKSFLGDKAADLPSSGLLFPLSVKSADHDEAVVRTILAVNEAEQSITFAGDIPQGATVKLMKAGIDNLIEGSNLAAGKSVEGLNGSTPELAILISCVGRKLVLKQQVEEEIESAARQLSPSTAITGFYSYGELSPITNQGKCDLHNQTMTITTISEA
jgi:hypothetical protein